MNNVGAQYILKFANLGLKLLHIALCSQGSYLTFGILPGEQKNTDFANILFTSFLSSQKLQNQNDIPVILSCSFGE